MSEQRSFHEDPVLYDRVSTPPAASVEFYASLARETRGDVLELACGTGRVAIPIAEAIAGQPGRAVTGLDLAPAMLGAARAKADAAGVELELPLSANGLRLEARYGDFGREPFASESPCQVCICHVDDARAPAR